MNLAVNITIDKLVHGGQGLASLDDGRKVFVWNALPGEKVNIRLLKSKKDYAEAIAEEILQPSPDRILPEEPASYLATSPWQIMTFKAENNFKKAILQETFEREGIQCPEMAFYTDGKDHAYRNKMEFGFWGDDQGISLAHFVRGSHGKTKVLGSRLALPSINEAASSIVEQLNSLRPAIRAGDLKSVIIRANQKGQTVAALFVKPKSFPELTLPSSLNGLVVYHSNPKSPASVATQLLQEKGNRLLSDTILGVSLSYDVLSFFQVNVPVFEMALKQIDYHTDGLPKVDFYSGVGSIGIPIGMTKTLVEVESVNTALAWSNATGLPIEVIESSSEKALQYITSKEALIVDPPRAGLHKDVLECIAKNKPPVIVYLSCNPSTQARDVKILCESGYDIALAEGYNFFPRTPHIESLVVLRLHS